MCILFVEDEFMITMMAEEALLEAGHEVMTAAHAPAAVGLISDHPGHFTCLVTDIHMPGEITGLDLVEHARKRYPLLPIVVATARPGAASPEWRNRRRVRLLTKPYGPELLVRTVDRLLEDVHVIIRPEFWNDRLIRLEGEIARETGVPRWQNPHVFGARHYRAWAQGWDLVDDGDDDD